MEYLIFNTLEEAIAANNRIQQNIVGFLTNNEPQAVKNGGLVGRNALTGKLEPDKCLTTTWADPIELDDGKWAIPRPSKDILKQPLNGKFIPDAFSRRGLGGAVVASIKRKIRNALS